ncbi:MAG TPA: P1 family peptidase [Gemmatimonadaceae bacterium]|jgi:L-aminopeptidase/D-esterase-like protein|nr:P1 family peptidase [Gemmatimonadaceae bacterium]
MNRRHFLGAAAMTTLAARRALAGMVVRAPGNHAAAGGLTDVRGLRVGHFTDSRRPTGCTVVLYEPGAIAGVDVRGSAPGTRETDLLSPVNTVDRVNAIVLAGGSAFGLDSASGVMRWLGERDVGYATAAGKVPIVPAAILYDLNVGDGRIRPGADAGYAACQNATAGTVAEGSVGAGAGATVGKLGGGKAMKGGIGTASISFSNGLVVAALVAVNCVGDVIDPATGRIVAGARTTDGSRFVDLDAALRSGAGVAQEGGAARSGQNTTIGVVATNARFDKTQMTKVAQMAQDGLARSINPAHTPYDGDTLFALTTAESRVAANLAAVGALAADVVSQAILRAVMTATSVAGFPSYREIASRH